jgi:hypothetical protein
MEKRSSTAVEKVQPKKGINWPAVYQYMLDYCNDTTIHGFKVNRFPSCQIEFPSSAGSSRRTFFWRPDDKFQEFNRLPNCYFPDLSFMLLGRVVNLETFSLPWITFGYKFFSLSSFMFKEKGIRPKLTFSLPLLRQYMGETSRPWIERIFWMVAFVISTIGCALLIAEMFEKLQTNPITVSLAERPSSIQEVSEPCRN